MIETIARHKATSGDVSSQNDPSPRHTLEATHRLIDHCSRLIYDHNEQPNESLRDNLRDNLKMIVTQLDQIAASRDQDGSATPAVGDDLQSLEYELFAATLRGYELLDEDDAEATKVLKVISGATKTSEEENNAFRYYYPRKALKHNGLRTAEIRAAAFAIAEHEEEFGNDEPSQSSLTTISDEATNAEAEAEAEADADAEADNTRKMKFGNTLRHLSSRHRHIRPEANSIVHK